MICAFLKRIGHFFFGYSTYSKNSTHIHRFIFLVIYSKTVFVFVFYCRPLQWTACGQVPVQVANHPRTDSPRQEDAGFVPGTSGQQAGALAMSQNITLTYRILYHTIGEIL
jgi:hypothetical protein